MSKVIVKGGKPLEGEVNICGNKNAALPIVAATILSDKKIKLTNVPNITDVKVLLRIMKSLGSKIRYAKKGSVVTIDNSNLSPKKLDKEAVGKFRGSILLIGPILARFHKVETWMPGGCKLGERPIDTHLISLQKLGAKIKNEEWIEIEGEKLIGTKIWLDEASVTGTENIIMASIYAKGTTEIYNAACEPHVQDLCNFLNSLGANIKGVGSNYLVIEGIKSLKGGEWKIIEDHMEVGTFISAAMMTNGEIVIHTDLYTHLDRIMFDFRKLGLKVNVEKEKVIVKKQQRYRVSNMIGEKMNKIDCFVWPAFPADLLQFMIVNATKSKGQILIHDKMYEGRLYFAEQLKTMGAIITVCDPHRVIVSGPTKLKATKLIAPDIRAGAALTVAALSANGESEINGFDQVERGYGDIIERLNSIGASIVKA